MTLSAIVLVSVGSIEHVNAGDPETFKAGISVTCLTLAADDPDGSTLAGMAAAVSDSMVSINLATSSPAADWKAGNDTAFEETPAMIQFQFFFSL